MRLSRARGGVGRPGRADVQPAGHDAVRRGRAHGDAAQRPDVFHPPERRPAKRVSLRLAVKAGSLYEADDQLGLAHLIEHMAFNGSAHFKPGELVVVLRVGRRAARAARQRVHELRRDGLHARPAERQAGGRREGADRARRLRRRPDAVAARKSTRNAASSSRNGAAGSAPDRASATSSFPMLFHTRATPSGCRSASRRSSATRRSRGCARSTTPGIARSAWR